MIGNECPFLNDRVTTISGHFFTNCMFIFHKTEVQTVILRCLTGLNLNWFKSYGLRCNLRPRASSVNSQKITTDKWPFYDQIWPFFCQPHGCLSQNWDSDSHWHKSYDTKQRTPKVPICVFEQNCKTPKMDIFAFCIITLEPIRF